MKSRTGARAGATNSDIENLQSQIDGLKTK
jgi:hypothetical protein